MSDKDLIEWLLRILGVLIGVICGLMARELYSLRIRVHKLENWNTLLSLNLSFICHKLGLPFHDRPSKPE